MQRPHCSAAFFSFGVHRRVAWLALALALVLWLGAEPVACADDEADIAKLNEVRPQAAKIAEKQAAILERARVKLVGEVERARQDNPKSVVDLERKLQAIIAARDFYQGYADDCKTRADINQALLAMIELQQRNETPGEDLRQRHRDLCAKLDQIIARTRQAEEDYHRLTGEELVHPATAALRPRTDTPGEPRTPAKSGTSETL